MSICGSFCKGKKSKTSKALRNIKNSVSFTKINMTTSKIFMISFKISSKEITQIYLN